MNYETLGKRAALLPVVAAALLLTLPAFSQGRGGGQGGPPPSAKDAAPMDLTGYWVSIVTEDWRYRMVTPAKGDYASVPLNPEGRKVADTWDPAKDESKLTPEPRLACYILAPHSRPLESRPGKDSPRRRGTCRRQAEAWAAEEQRPFDLDSHERAP
jgi:hypothetical protein